MAGEVFELGTVSLGWIDDRNLFDAYQENHDINSAIIFKTTGADKTGGLADAITNQLQGAVIRSDIGVKITLFCQFLRKSIGVELEIN